MVSPGPDSCSAPRLPRFLLPLLLCLTLIASAVGSAWAATAMAMPAAVPSSSSAGERSCHDRVPGLHADEEAGHSGPVTGCADDTHCDCPQQGTVLLPAPLPLLMDLPQSDAPLPADAGRASLAPGRLIRPPIA